VTDVTASLIEKSPLPESLILDAGFELYVDANDVNEEGDQNCAANEETPSKNDVATEGENLNSSLSPTRQNMRHRRRF